MIDPVVINANEVSNINVTPYAGGTVIRFDVSENNFWLGEKTVEISPDVNNITTVAFDNDAAGQLGFRTEIVKDGVSTRYDLICEIYGIVKDASAEGKHVDTSKVIGSLRILNGASEYFIDDDKYITFYSENNFENWSTAYQYFEIGNKNATVAQNLKGSYLSETFYCGKGDDIVDVGPGGGDNAINSVYLNTGNAKVTLCAVADENIYIQDTFKNSSGDDSFWIPQEAIFSKGGSTIIGADGSDVLSFADTARNVTFYRKGNDLVVFEFIPRNFQYGNSTRKAPAYEARVNIKDYYTAQSKIEMDGLTDTEDEDKNEYYRSLINNATNLIEGKGKLKGTYNSEGIVASAKSTIYTGAGDDEVYLSTGNDTVNIDGAGSKIIYASGATGHNTININDKNAYVDIEFIGTNPFQSNIGTPYIGRSGNDLIIRAGYSYNYASSGYNSSSVTVKNFFKNQYDLEVMGRDIGDFLNANFYVNGNTKNKNTLYGSTYNEVITGGKKKDTIYTGAGNDTVYATEGNDTVIVDGAGTKLIDITDGNITIDRKDATAIVKICTDDDQAGNFMQKSKNDLILRAYCYDGVKYSQRKAVIKNAFNPDGSVKNGFEYNGSSLGELYANYKYITGKGKITLKEGNENVVVSGSAKNDKITTSANVNNNIVFAGNGKDTINLGLADNTVYGEGGNDTINVSAGSTNYIYAGSGNDTININSGSGNYIYMDAGNDTLNINKDGTGSNNTLFFNDGGGKDKINVKTSSCGLSLYFKSGNAENNDYDCAKSGDNLVITRYHEDAKGRTKSDSVTINEFFKNEGSLLGTTVNNKSIGSIINNGAGLIVKGTYNKKAKTTYFYSSSYKDIIVGTVKKDVINMKNQHYDYSNLETVTTGKGNDIVNIETNRTNMYLNMADGDGNDILKFSDTVVSNPAYTQVNIQYTGKGSQGYSKNGDDLVLYNVYEDNKGNVKTDSLVVKEFYKSFDTIYDYSGQTVKSMTNAGSITDYEYFVFSKKDKWDINVDSNRLIVAGDKNDTIKVNADRAIIYAGKGNDNITVKKYAEIHAGKGNDTITINNNGYDVDCYFSKGDGNDTIVAQSTYDNLNLYLDGFLPDSITSAPSALSYIENNYLNNEKMGFRTNGEDLIFYRPNGKKQETITFKGACSSSSNFSLSDTNLVFMGKNSTPIAGFSINDLLNMTDPITATGNYNKKTKTTTYNGAYNLSSEFNYSGKGKAIIQGGSNDDLYDVTFSKKTDLKIFDSNSSDGGDYLQISAKASDVSIFFDVCNDGKIGLGEMGLLMFQKGCMNNESIHWQKNAAKGRLVVSDYFGGNPEVYGYYENTDMLVGNGKIETILIDNKFIAAEDWISGVAFDVAQWLNQNNCGSAMYVLNNGTQDQINSLLAVYQGHTADEFASAGMM